MTTTPTSQAFDAARRLYQAGQLAQAEEACRRVVQADAGQSEALQLLGLIAARTDRDDEAIDYLDAALRLRPDLVDALNIRGIVLVKRRRLAEAVESFRRALRIRPDSVAAHCNLGNALREQGDLDGASAGFREALRLRPDSAEAHNNLGSILQQQGKWAEAEPHLRQAARLRPDSAEIWFNLGLLLSKLEKSEEALACNIRAVRLRPDHAEAHANLGNNLMERGQVDAAIASYRAALDLKPDSAPIHSNLVRALHFHPGYDARSILDEARRWDARHARPLRGEIRPHANRPDPGRRLRIGYVSPDFRDHVDSFFMIPLLSNHDHEVFEIICYADVRRPDALTERLRGHADAWREIAGLSDRPVADLVREDEIDILVDLKLHTADNRLLVFARKPAPVQVAWLGYPGTTGLSTMDDRLTDPYLDPPGLFDDAYSEQSVRLPDTFWCYDPLTDGPAVSEPPALASGAITFGCLNSLSKVNEGCLALWARVLHAVPGSRLLLLAPVGPARDAVLDVLRRWGIAEARVRFAERRPRPEYLELYRQVDIGLDPLPCNGHTTSLDAFWMGVPTLTLPGRTAVGRAGWSQLCNLGLRELAAETPDAFVALAAGLAGDLPRLVELRRTLRERMARSPLMDAPQFARHVEAAYRRAWHRWCGGTS